MKFIEKIIENVIDRKLIEVFLEIEILQQGILSIKHTLSSLNGDISDNKNEILNQEILLRNNSREIELKILELRKDLDISINGIANHYDKKFESIGEKKLVTELLKKIAKLEGNNVST